MQIGIISDTHDNLTNIRKAVSVFAAEGVQTVLHGGDFCSPFTLAEFKPLVDKGAKMYAVFGNNDGDKLLLAQRGEGICSFKDGVYVLTVEGKRIVLMHYPDVSEDLLQGGSFDLVVCGHNHRAAIKGEGKVLVNPGTCAGYLAERATVAIVDTTDMKAKLVEL